MAHVTDAQLFVRPADGRLTYWLNVLEPRFGAGCHGGLSVPWGKESAARVDALVGRMARLTETGGVTGVEAEEELAGIGLELFDHLVPEVLGRALFGLVERASGDRAPTLLVLSQESSIPWELVKLRRAEDGSPGPFLAEAFAMSRWLDGPGHVFELPLRSIALVAPTDTDLKSLPEERAFVLGLEGEGREVTEVPAQVEPLLDHFAMGTFEGWHFAGHGMTAGTDPSAWSLLLEGNKPLTSYLLKNRARHLGRPHPLVFANACRSARRGPGLTRVGGLAQTFLELGAGAFVGTLWEIDDGRGLRFARAFYRHFLAGVPIAEAVRRTRLELRDDLAGESTWLAYTVFAHPLATCGHVAEGSAPSESPSPLGLPRSTWQPDRSPPGALLRAEYGVVPFHGRNREMEDLWNWARGEGNGGGARLALRLYTGPGGMGKTRLALELCERLRDDGWIAGFVARERQTPADELARRIAERTTSCPEGRPLLVVVDYAETERDLLVPLLRELMQGDGKPVRVVLLARAALDWWDQLKTVRTVGDLLSGPATTRHALAPLALDDAERIDSYRLAAAAFSERLGQAPPETVPDDLGADHYQRVLLLHMSALAALQGVDVRGEDGLLDYVLDRERRFWREAAEQRGIAPDLLPGIGRALAVITLGGGVSGEDQAIAVLAGLPDFADQPHAVRRNVARLLHDCYPGAHWIEPVQPDLLGEHLAERELGTDPDLLLRLVLGDEDE